MFSQSKNELRRKVKSLFLCAIFFPVFLLLLSGCGETEKTPLPIPQNPQRIVSTAPSITEILFALGLGERVAGVTRFCRYPHEAISLPKIGDLLNPNWEAMIILHPDLIITLAENQRVISQAKQSGISYLAVDHTTLDGIFDSFALIAEHFGSETVELAEKVRAKIETRLREIEDSAKTRRAVRCLICVDRLRGTGRIQGVFAAGNTPFYAEILRLTGGENVVTTSIPFPTLSLETILQLNPEVIIDLVTADINDANHSEKPVKTDWELDAPLLDAVRNNKVFEFTADYATIPGPRVIDFIEEIAELFSKIAQENEL